MFKRHTFFEWLNHLSPAKLLMFFYFIALVISTFILSLPIAYHDGVSIDFIDKVFTAVSALSVTGLTTVSIADTFNTTGIILLTIILHLGLLGVMTVSTFIWLLFGKKIGISERRLIMQDQNQYNFGGMVGFIKQIIIIVLSVELISIIILGIYNLKYYNALSEAFFNAYFTTISAMSNAGFALTNNSYADYKGDYFLQIILMFLIIFGAIGYPVLIEVKHFFTSLKKAHRRFRFSLFTKLTSITFFILIIVGTIFIYLFDRTHFFSDKGWVEGFFYALFQSVTTRSAGLSTFDVATLTETNQLFMSLLMFIGASPSSSGGGIRTTTFALVIIFLITYIRGGAQLKIFNREVYDSDLNKAVTIIILATTMIFLALILLTLLEPFSMIELLFEVTSAFGTVGLSLGITAELTVISKIILMLLMFIGRIGLVTFILTFRKNDQTANIRYPKERIIIG